MLAELARGKTVGWVASVQTTADWPEYVNVPLGESRKRSCLMLPLTCLRKAVATLFVPPPPLV
jgi:hypothetical protein